MKTGIQLVDDTYSLLDIPEVHSVIASGDIFPDNRPDGHKRECIVINSLPITGRQLQRAVVNVNVHVPNLKLTIEGQPDNSQPNRQRLQQILTVILPLLEDGLINNSVTEIQDVSRPMKEEGINEHFVNIRLGTNSINLK